MLRRDDSVGGPGLFDWIPRQLQEGKGKAPGYAKSRGFAREEDTAEDIINGGDRRTY